MNLIAFLAVSLALFAALLLVLHRDDSLRPAERLAAAYSLLVYTLHLLGFHLGFAGMMRLRWVLVGMTAMAVAGGWWALVHRREDGRAAWRSYVARVADWYGAQSWASLATLAVALCCGAFFLRLGWMLPVVDYDGLSYHLGLTLHMAQDGDMRHYPGESGYTNYFARGYEVVAAILLKATGTIAVVNTVQWFVLPAMVMAGYGAGRGAGLRVPGATMAAAASLFVPVIMYQSSMAYVDLWSNGWWFVAVCAVAGGVGRRVSTGRMLWMFAAAGMALAAKYNAAVGVALLGLVAMAVWGWRAFLEPRWAGLGRFAVGFAFAGAVALAWPCAIWQRAGSPIYPWSVEFAGITIAEGIFPMATLRTMPDPPPFSERSLADKFWESSTAIDLTSWHTIPAVGMRDLPAAALHDHTFGYRGDNRFGGLGLAWLMLYGPAMLLVAAGGWWVNWRVALVLGVLPVATAWLGVASYWPRFSCALPPLGALCFFVIAQHLADRWRGACAIAVATFVVAAGFDAATITLLNRDRERVRRFVAETGGSQRPIDYMLWLAPAHAEYRAIRALMDAAQPGDTVSFHTPGSGTFTGLFASADAGVRLFPFPSVWPAPESISRPEMLAHIRAERIVLLLTGPTAWPALLEALPNELGATVIWESEGFRVYRIGQ